MKTKLLLKKPKALLLLICSLFLLSSIPYYFAGSGLDNPEPMGSYLNGNFPGILPQGLPYQPVFPNITFDSPLTFNELPSGDKIIVGQRDGKIFWFDKNPNVTTKNSLIDLSEKVGVVWDGGFLGLALHPEFGAGKNYFYVWYTTEDANSNDFPNRYTTQSCDSEEYWGNFLILARYEANPTTLNVQASSEQVMLKLRMYGTTHRGGGLLFGNDGFLYLTTGDQTAFKKSQDIVNNLDGGVLRLDVDQDPAKSHPPVRTMPDDHGFSDELTGNGYWIPNDNPFLSPTGTNFEEYYSMGHRNPHRMTKDRETGALYVGEIGGGRHEEINIIKKGGNFGWPLYEGLYRSTFCVQNLYNNMPHEQPLLAFPRSEANAIIGGYVYRGNEIPELRGKYICADYGNGEEIFTVDINTGQYEQYGNFTSTNIISFGEDNQGELYILKQGVSSLFKVTSKNVGFGNTPQLLSETGAFSDLNNLTPTDGLIPYDLVESFWSDGALKKRWMAIPNDGSHNTAAEKINYSDVDDWDFPVGSVLVKHFELPINENNPSITKRLETRFSVKASDGNFYFVTYKWNEQQTDAVLLTSGLDESISITKADGSTASQTWSYPSNIDCITCHNPTTGGTLGTRARYLNKDFTYSETGRTANQLVTLSHLGILDQTVSDSDTNSILTSKAIDDPTATVDEKARSYMDLNCAYCHRPGTGNRGDFDLRLNLDLVQTGLLSANPYIPLGIPNEKIIDPGNSSTSILYHRINSTDPTIRMPPIAKNKLDAKAVQLIDDWINQLDPDLCSDRIIMETFTNVPGTSIAELKANVNFPDSPNSVDELNEFRIPVNVADDYGVRVKGLLKAPETGTYYFWVAGDDNVELNLSSDANEANKTRIAYHNGWSYDAQWNKYATQKSAGIDLVAGQNYYIEALMNERGGGDNLSVGWRKPSNGDGTLPFQVIPCTAFDLFSGPPVTNVTYVSLTPETATLTEGDTQQFSATVSPADATDTSVSWSSSDTGIAIVDTNGLVTAIAEGNATITVTTTDGDFTDASIITVEAAVIDVTGVTLTPETATLVEGDNQQLSAIVNPSDATDTSVSWSSSDTGIAIVDNNGLVTAIAEGNTTIMVTTTDGDFTDASIITVEAAVIDVTGVTLAPATTTLVEGGTQQLSAMVSPADATDTSVSWSSSDTGIAIVDNNGLVTAVSEGNATITVTTTDGGFTDTSITTVEAAVIDVTGVTLTPDTATLVEGDTQQLSAIMSPSDATDTSVTWSSSDAGIAIVDNNGLVTAISEGNATITVTTTDGDFTDTSIITVEAAVVNVTGVSVSPQSVSLNLGLTQQLTATIFPNDADNTAVSWSSDNLSVATVDSEGLVSATGRGTATIRVETIDGGFTAETLVTVNVPVTGVVVAPQNVSINPGDTTQLSAQVAPSGASDTTIAWESSNTNIATVDATGLVSALAVGDVVITVTTNDGGFTAQSDVSVVEPIIGVTGVNLNPANVDLNPGGTAQLSAQVIPAGASDNSLTWESSDTNIAIVDAAGLVTAVAAGDAIITVTTNDGGFTAQSNVSVEEPIVDVAGVNLNPANVDLNPGGTAQLSAQVIPAGASDKSLTWESSNTNIAIVDPAGLVTAVAVGDATITVTTNDGGFSAQSNVSVRADNGQDCSVEGAITMRRYDNINGISLNNFFNAPSFPDNPSLTFELDSFEIPAYVANNYGAWVSGFLCAPETGTYYFWISGDDHVRLNLSTDDNSANKTTIAFHNGHTNYRMWDRFDSQKSVGIQLEQGKSYYIESFLKEGVGGDHLSVAWRKPSDGAGEAPTEIIPGNVLSPNLDIPYEIAVSNVSVDRPFISLLESDTATINALVSPSNAANQNVSWQSSDNSVATVDANGVVYAISLGNAVITVTTDDGGFTAQTSLTVREEDDQNCSAAGTITMRRYDDIGGITLNDLFVATDFPDNPTITTELSSFEIPTHVADNYGAWVSGYLCAPETGTYYFWVAGDNHVQLNLSVDDNMANATTIAYHNGHTNSRVWNKYDTQKSVGIELEKGQSYYIEGYLKELNGGDHLAVAWSKPSDNNSDVPSEIIPGTVLSPNTAQIFPLQASFKDFIEVSVFNIYPNPTFDLLHIETAPNENIRSVRIFDATGRVVMVLPQSEFQGKKDNEINVSHLSKGVYTIVIFTDDYRKYDDRFIKR